MIDFMQAFLTRLTTAAAAQDSAHKSAQWHEPHGGLALPRNKPGLPILGEPITDLALPDQLVFPLLDYTKKRVQPLVQIGSTVAAGDTLAPGVLASAAGRVCAIEPRSVIHPSNQSTQCIVIDVDHDAQQNPPRLPAIAAQSIERIERAGIKGLGGAGFNTADKLMAAIGHSDTINTLLVNAVECEPQISCDEALIRSDAQTVIKAIHAMVQFTGCKRCILAIEDDKLEAITELQHHLSSTQHGATTVPVELATLSAIYPSGAEKVLIQRIFGTSPDTSRRASDQGILCLNVATVLAAWRAQNGHPMLSRVVTIAGDSLRNPCNVRVRFGTSVLHVLQQTNNLADGLANVPVSELANVFPIEGGLRVRAGGPLSGFDLQSLSVPITATTNCITVELLA